MNRLTKYQARLLLPAVVDNEVSEQEKKDFFEYLKHDPELKREYYSTLKVKQILSENLPRKSAPDHLRKKILHRLEVEKRTASFKEGSSSVKKTDESSKWNGLLKSGFRYIAAAAVILLITLMTVQLLERSTDSFSEEMFVIENISAQHFQSAKNVSIEPPVQTASLQEAESYLRDHYGMNMTIPHLKGTDFVGLVMADFHSGMQAPLLKYIQRDIGENIYIFAFNLDQLENFDHMKREENAAKSCTTQTDYFVNNIDGTHVVSWLWDDNWYSAVSNHNGHDLAALVEPLNIN
ncbi:hypothetical protein [Rhodohalobacter sp.]|uniref:anti-sigma factor family protein n=1 Tax=Rhodohalobacter sp. TaxID=1974210 RepID=UPI002ACDE15A|nr:hypothetical protein [Rhodohalobacter sp.]MDZ7756867.1 hypothetical protein [Rhodohalobacter sp.]